VAAKIGRSINIGEKNFLWALPPKFMWRRAGDEAKMPHHRIPYSAVYPLQQFVIPFTPNEKGLSHPVLLFSFLWICPATYPSAIHGY
jgi:hypothetical protein